MAMAPIDDDNLPEGLRADLHRLVPSMPDGIADRERGMLDQAHRTLARQRGRRMGWRYATGIGAAGAAIAAALLLAVTLFHTNSRSVAPIPPAIATAHRPTIVDAMVAARKAGAKQSEIDEIAMAAVRLDLPEVH